MYVVKAKIPRSRTKYLAKRLCHVRYLVSCIFRMLCKNVGTDLSVILSEIDRGTDVQGCLC